MNKESEQNEESDPNKEFNKRYKELSGKVRTEKDAKVAELAHKQTETKEHDYSKKKHVVLVQMISGLALAIIGASFTILTDMRSNTLIKEQEKTRKSQMATQLMSQRETSETEFRKGMFSSLIQQILDDTMPLKRRMNVLEVFENNFNDIFNSRSLYDVLWDEAVYAGDSSIKTKLIDLARYIGAKQQSQINQLEWRQTLCCSPVQDSLKYIFEENEIVKICLIDIEESRISITMTIECDEPETSNKRRTIKINDGKPFHVSYFDTPFSSNFMMPDEHRIAIIPEEIFLSNNSVRLDVIHFPADYVTMGYRPSIRSLNKMLGDSTNQDE